MIIDQEGNIERVAEDNANTAAEIVEAAVENTVMIAENEVAEAERRAEVAEERAENAEEHVAEVVEQLTLGTLQSQMEGLTERCQRAEEVGHANRVTLTEILSTLATIQAQLSSTVLTEALSPPNPPLILPVSEEPTLPATDPTLVEEATADLPPQESGAAQRAKRRRLMLL